MSPDDCWKDVAIHDNLMYSEGVQMTINTPIPSSIRNALYYPFPYAQNENWLKEQALFWDHLYRIVPSDFREMNLGGERIDPTITERVLRDELDFIQDCEVDEDAHI